MHRLWDKLGISLSFLCLIHCLLLPVLSLLAPSLGHLTHQHGGEDSFNYTHLILAIFIWPAALLAFIPAYKHHKKKWVLILGFLGLIIITFSLIWGHDILGHNGETISSVIGSLILVFAHYQNYICNRCQSCHDNHINHANHHH